MNTRHLLIMGNKVFAAVIAVLMTLAMAFAVQGTAARAQEVIDPGLIDELPDGQISGWVFEDLNGNGVRDTGEGGLWNWKVFIDANANGSWDADEISGNTNMEGEFLLFGLTPGEYRVDLENQAGWTQTTPSAGAFVLNITPADMQLEGLTFGNQRTGTVQDVTDPDAVGGPGTDVAGDQDTGGIVFDAEGGIGGGLVSAGASLGLLLLLAAIAAGVAAFWAYRKIWTK